ncbi:MAG: hypothetical protein Q8M15_10520 [Bacteroidota bacterium]|nr:hypothetical protein [Bacteroidota bacterium]
MKKQSLADILNLLKIGEIDEETIKKDLPPGDFEEFHQYSNLFNEITETLSKNILGKSEVAKHLVFINSILHMSGIEEHNYEEKVIDPDAREFLNLFFQLYKQTILNENHHINWDKLQKLIGDYNKTNNPTGTLAVDTQLIYSIFFDYEFFKEIKTILPKLNPEWIKIFKEIKANLVSSMGNAASFMDKDLNEFVNKKSTVYGDNNNYQGFYFTPDIIAAIQKSLEPYIELNEKIFKNSITGNLLKKLLEYVLNYDSFGFENTQFHKLKDVFGVQTKMDDSHKKLLLHEIFTLYNHPGIISNEEALNGIYSTFSHKDLRQAKIRKVEALIK